MFEFRNVAKKIGQDWIIQNVSFEIKKGEKVIIFGPSGSGKSTLIKLLNKIYEHDKGEILFNGQNVNTLDLVAFRRDLGYVVQSIGLFPHWTIFQNIAIAPVLKKWSKSAIKNRVEDLMVQLKLPLELSGRYPHQLSGGQQQRVGVARAMAAKPAAVLMDEPFGALDHSTRIEIRKELKSSEEFIQGTFMIVTHDAEEAVDLGDSVLLVEQGRVSEKIAMDDLLFKSEFHLERRRVLGDQVLNLQLKRVKLSEVLPWLDLVPDINLTPFMNNTIYELIGSDPIFDVKQFGISRSAILDAFYKKINPSENFR